jgi:glucose-1-phosphate thymidylyltransferase
MKVVLLCAGYATRLYPLTENHPKPLLPVADKPIVEYLLEKLEQVRSVDEVLVVTNGRFYPRFKEWAEKSRWPWKTVVVNDGTQSNETRLGAIGDLLLTLRKFPFREDLAVFAGDNLFSFDLRDFFPFAESHRPHVSVGVVDIRDKGLAQKYGIVEPGEGGRIKAFFEKPKEPPTTLVSTGVYWFPKESLGLLDRYVQEGHNADRPGDYLTWLVKVDRVFAYRFEGIWFDIGDFDSYREAERLFRQTKEKTKR